MASESGGVIALQAGTVASPQKAVHVFAFRGLMFFTFVLFVGPQLMFPFLQPLHLAKVSAGLGLLTYVVERLNRGRGLTVKTPTVHMVLWLLAVAAVGIPFSSWPGGSWDGLVNDFAKSVLVFVLIANTVNTARRMKLMIGSMAALGVVMAWTAVRDFSAGNLAKGGIRIAGYESPMTGDPNDLSLTLNMIMPLALALLLGTRNAVARALLLGAILAMAAGVVASFSRGGFLGLATILIVFLVKRGREKGLATLVPILAILVLALFVLPAGYGDRIYTIWDTSEDATGSANARWDGMVGAFRLMLQHPLFGLGLGQHVLAFPARGLGWSGVHSAYLQVGADLGVPGFALYVLATWHMFKEVRKARKELVGLPGARELLALCLGMEIAIPGFVIGAFLLPVAYRFYFYYLAGFAVALHQIAKRFAAKSGSPTPTGHGLSRGVPANA